ncbi:MAG: hypothetical protein IJP45_03855, partial [Paludibacteraceae bacterium]|nr:hypothetical protein [Paludibacteraceae bacterium]
MRKTFTLLIALLALTVSSWATTVTWDATDLATVHVEMGYNSPGQSQTIKDITVTNNAVYTAGQNCDFLYQESPYNYCGFSMRDGGSLIFSSSLGNLTGIVITCDLYPSEMTLPSGWSWDGSNNQLKWSGDASSVVLTGDGTSTALTSGPISSIVFTIGSGAAVEKDDIDMYFQDYDNSTYQNVRISEFEMIMDETGYFESHTIEFKWSLPGVPNVTFASSDDESLEVDAEADAIGNDRYLVSFYPHSHGHFTVTATFNGDAQYNQATATLEVYVINSRYSFAKDLVF